jgi:rhomboid protease GluP
MTIQQLFKTAPVTTLLLIGFIGLFVIQVLSGVDANNPSTAALLKWGANALPYTMGDEPWRLVSSAFLHIGLMHLLFNGFAMYFFGQIAEPMFGSAKFLALFLLAAIGGNLLNSYVTWQDILNDSAQPGISAGASGGIMGIGAALLIAALFKISVNGMVLNLKSLVFIMGINLVYGFAVPGIDNAGHIGGALTGLVIALAIGIVHHRRLAIMQAMTPTYQAHYVTYQNTDDYNDGINTNVNNTAVDAPINNYNNSKSSTLVNANPQPFKLALIWQLLPWIVMLLVTIGFVWWWQDIHYQILQVLAATE